MAITSRIGHSLCVLAVLLLSTCGSYANESELEIDWTLYFNLNFTLLDGQYVGPQQSQPEDFVGLGIGLDFYVGNFFIESDNQFRRSATAGTLGYRAYSSESFQFDVLLGQTYIYGLSENIGNVYREPPSNELDGIETRKDDFSQGFRFAFFNDNSAWWVDIASGVALNTHEGSLIDAYYSKRYQVRNWDLQLGAGLTLFSSNVINYYAGVSEEEQTASRVQYEADSGYRVMLEAAAQYPISEDFLFRVNLTRSQFSSAFHRSPLYESASRTSLDVSVVYVW
ncbi:MipA/OmpV family protein [Ningiella sp. W23]|uniref:MipA/OmpV family protein n=1 Tax=Ningiella sp. W23 TaxID=3023715 RepID=UPI003757649A